MRTPKRLQAVYTTRWAEHSGVGLVWFGLSDVEKFASRPIFNGIFFPFQYSVPNQFSANAAAYIWTYTLKLITLTPIQFFRIPNNFFLFFPFFSIWTTSFQMSLAAFLFELYHCNILFPSCRTLLDITAIWDLTPWACLVVTIPKAHLIITFKSTSFLLFLWQWSNWMYTHCIQTTTINQ